jgi:hypothetical protein
VRARFIAHSQWFGALRSLQCGMKLRRYAIMRGSVADAAARCP